MSTPEKLSDIDQAVYQGICDRYFKSLHHTSNFEKVVEFMKIMRQSTPEMPTIAPEGIESLRVSLIREEFNELQEGIRKKDLVEIADALADLLYVVYGTAAAYGIDIDACFAEVHRSNMSKLGEDGQPIFREDGKVLKSSKYTPPQLGPILFPKNKD
jgi:predicted HAD superfamily Cof-like phosphohydrolase